MDAIDGSLPCYLKVDITKRVNGLKPIHANCLQKHVYMKIWEYNKLGPDKIHWELKFNV